MFFIWFFIWFNKEKIGKIMGEHVNTCQWRVGDSENCWRAEWLVTTHGFLEHLQQFDGFPATKTSMASSGVSQRLITEWSPPGNEQVTWLPGGVESSTGFHRGSLGDLQGLMHQRVTDFTDPPHGCHLPAGFLVPSDSNILSWISEAPLEPLDLRDFLPWLFGFLGLCGY